MKLSYNSKYKSIGQFREIVVEDFSVFIGLNGSGKTHLLRAINEGFTKFGDIDKEKIVYFDLQTFLIKNQKSFTLRNLDTEKSNAWQLLVQQKNWFSQNDTKIRKKVGKIDFPYNIKDKISKSDNISGITNFIDRIAKQNKTKKLLKSGILNSGKYASDISQEEFIRYSNYDPDEYELLESLSEIFVDYHRKIIIASLPKNQGGLGYRGEKLAEFKNKAPWNFINDMLSTFGLSHKVTMPLTRAADVINSHSIPFQVKLIIDEEEIEFEDLSSGEKILCALTITVYQDQKSIYPELLLLDEIDAFLHPTMIKNLLSVITNIFIQENCKVCLATHSPTTVALVPEKSLFEIQKDNTPKKIKKINRSDAINILSEGFITLEKGLKIFDEIFKKELTVISEGKNQQHIKKAIKVFDNDLTERIQFYEHDSGSGEADLFGLYEFIKKIDIENKVLFIWDCDSMSRVSSKTEGTNVFKYCFTTNESNSYTKKGIENLFDDSLFTEEFIKIVTISEGDSTRVIREFLNNKKNIFLNKVLRLRDKKHFENFVPLIDKIKSII